MAGLTFAPSTCGAARNLLLMKSRTDQRPTCLRLDQPLQSAFTVDACAAWLEGTQQQLAETR